MMQAPTRRRQKQDREWQPVCSSGFEVEKTVSGGVAVIVVAIDLLTAWLLCRTSQASPNSEGSLDLWIGSYMISNCGGCLADTCLLQRY